jgi:hypothetical protein
MAAPGRHEASSSNFSSTSVATMTWVDLPGPMTLVDLVYIRVKAHEIYGPGQ